MFRCDWKYIIYIPKAAADANIEDSSATVISCVKGLMNGYFGGYTSYETEGGWDGPNGIEIEPGYALETVTHRSNCDKPLEHITNFILGHTKEKEVLITKSPIEILTYERKDYHNE